MHEYGEISIRELVSGDFEIWAKCKETHGLLAFDAQQIYHWGGNPIPIQDWEGAETGTAPTAGSEIFNSSTDTPNFYFDGVGGAIEIAGTPLVSALPPKTTAVTENGASTPVAASTWTNSLNQTNGPYVLYLVQNTDTTPCKFRIYADGDLVWESPSLLGTGGVDTGPGSALNVAPIFCRSELRIDVWASIGTTLDHVYVYHTMAFD
jgi:hypothetical protein